MTPECPKGPESEARPLGEQIERAIMAEDLAMPTRERREPDYDGVAARVDAVMAVVAPELERLTAKVARLDKLAGGWWRQSQENGRYAGSLRAEVSRLREQLAAQPSDLVERAAIWLFRAKTSQMLPDVLRRASKTWHQVLDQRDRDAWISYAREMLTDLGRGVSSSEVEAPQPQEMVQHKVLIYPGDPNLWTAYCQAPKCGQWSGGGTQQHAEDWKDQHEADTLRPSVESPIHQANRHDEGRPSGSEAAEPRSDEDDAIGQINEVRIWLARNGYAVNAEQPLIRDVRDAVRKAEADLGKALGAAGRAPEVVTEFADDDEDAAQSARSEATPKWICVTHQAGAGFPCPNCKPFSSSPIGELMDHIGASPSLRKEGEDSV